MQPYTVIALCAALNYRYRVPIVSVHVYNYVVYNVVRHAMELTNNLKLINRLI